MIHYVLKTIFIKQNSTVIQLNIDFFAYTSMLQLTYTKHIATHTFAKIKSRNKYTSHFNYFFEANR